MMRNSALSPSIRLVPSTMLQSTPSSSTSISTVSYSTFPFASVFLLFLFLSFLLFSLPVLLFLLLHFPFTIHSFTSSCSFFCSTVPSTFFHIPPLFKTFSPSYHYSSSVFIVSHLFFIYYPFSSLLLLNIYHFLPLSLIYHPLHLVSFVSYEREENKKQVRSSLSLT